MRMMDGDCDKATLINCEPPCWSLARRRVALYWPELYVAVSESITPYSRAQQRTAHACSCLGSVNQLKLSRQYCAQDTQCSSDSRSLTLSLSLEKIQIRIFLTPHQIQNHEPAFCILQLNSKVTAPFVVVFIFAWKAGFVGRRIAGGIQDSRLSIQSRISLFG